MARQGLVEDLLHVSSRLSWRTNLVVAAATAIFLHLAAITLTAPAGVTSTAGQGVFAGRNLLGTVAHLFQFVIPPVFLIGALVSYFRRSQATTLFGQAMTGGFQSMAKMSWAQFEQLIGEALRRRGFEVTETGGRTADGGVDLVLSKEGKRYLVQCKHWRVQSVGVGVVRELNGVVAARGAAGGYVVTSGVFTREAWAFAQTCAIELIDGEKLESLIRRVDRKRAEEDRPPAREATSAPPTAVECPKCGSAMVRRVAKKGSLAGKKFWGCSTYPGCRGVRPFLE